MAAYFFGITDKGNRRDSNEDAFIVQELSSGEFLLACVIDGVGGYEGGEIAAAIARESIVQQLQSLKDTADVAALLKQAVSAANAAIIKEKRSSELKEMACVLTCVITHISTNKCWYAHVGDTRLYLCRDQSLIKISKDHSVVGFLEESGRLTEEDAMRHPRRNEIHKALGFEEDIADMSDYIETGESPFLPGDLLMLCSDGLSDMLSSATMLGILLTPKSLAERLNALVTAANEAGGNDNITAILVSNLKEKLSQVAFMPAEKKIATPGKPVTHNKAPTVEEVLKTKRKNKKAITLLSILCLILLIVLMVSMLQKNNKAGESLRRNTQMPASINMDVSRLLQAKLNDSNMVQYTATDTLQPLVLNYPVTISKDSLYFKGGGMVISSSDNFKGPAFIIDTIARQVVIDSVVFKDFDVALLIKKNNVTLRHVRFINCRVPVQYEINLPDTMISGKLNAEIFQFIKVNK